MIGDSRICDIKRKDCKKDNKEKDSDDRKNVNNNDNNNNMDNDNNNSIAKLCNNKDQSHNFSDKVLNNLFIIAKLKEKVLINNEKISR